MWNAFTLHELAEPTLSGVVGATVALGALLLLPALPPPPFEPLCRTTLSTGSTVGGMVELTMGVWPNAGMSTSRVMCSSAKYATTSTFGAPLAESSTATLPRLLVLAQK